MQVEARQRTDAADHDPALITRIAARDPSAFRVLTDRHAPMLHRIAYRLTGDAHEAEDLAQEALLRLWQQAPRWEAGGLNPGAWLRRVTVNLAFDRLRSRKRLVGGEIPERVDEAPLADAQIEADQQVATARALIAALPERQRAAIVLTYYEELPNAEAAQVMDMQLKAFESLLFRARAALREAFTALAHDAGARP